MENTLVILPEEVKNLALKVSQEKQAEVNLVLNQIFQGTADWEAQIDAINIKDVNDKMSIALADAARKNSKNARLAAEKIFDAKREEVQNLKADYDLQDKLWLKAKQIMQLTFKSIEEKAEYKANFVKRFEAEQKELETQLRIEKVLKYSSEIQRLEFENMSKESFDVFLNGLKATYEDKIEAERKAEEERIKEAEALKLHNERKELILSYWNFLTEEDKQVNFGEVSKESFNVFLEKLKNMKAIEDQKQLEIQKENEKLKEDARRKKEKDEQIEKDRKELIAKRSLLLQPYIVFIRDYNGLINKEEIEFNKELEDIKKGAELQWKADAEKKIKADKEAEEKRLLQAKLNKIEQDKKDQKAKADKEAKDKAEAEKKAAKAPDKEKLLALKLKFESIEYPDLKTDEGKQTINDIKGLILEVSNFINERVEKL